MAHCPDTLQCDRCGDVSDVREIGQLEAGSLYNKIGEPHLAKWTDKHLVWLGSTRKRQVLGTNELDDRFHASAALAGNKLFLRGMRFLYCLSEGERPS